MKKYLCYLLTLIIFASCSNKTPEYMIITGKYVTIHGFSLGTSYKITYKDNEKRDFHDSFTKLFNDFENSLSIYRENSIISKVNRNENVVVDNYFTTMFNCAKEVSEKTDGYFDISAAPIFEIWGWGAKERETITDQLIDSLMQYVGMDKIKLNGNKVEKSNPNVTINANAIAKGYCSDVVADFLDKKGITDYLVEVGGEMVLKGKNRIGKAWTIGIDQPIDGNMIPGQFLQAKFNLTNRAIATSGNYRRFYVENGEKYSHTIDPKTGKSAKQNVLSATVIANNCILADALATAFMVMGVDGTKEFVKNNPDIGVFLIYSSNGEIKEYYTESVSEILEIVKN